MSGLMQSEQSIRPLMTPAWANNSRTHPEHPSRAAAWPALLSAAGQPSFDTKSFLAKVESGKTRCEIRQQIIFLQGDPADAIFYIDRGRIELRVSSRQGKEAILAVLGVGDFFGEECLVGQPRRLATAVAAADCTLTRLEKSSMVALLRGEPEFSALFISHLLTRKIRIEEDLVDQFFNSSEKRLARLLLLMANFGEEGKLEAVVPKVCQETLAEMIGTTRSRVSFFMNKFRKLGFIEYNEGLRVRSSLLNVLLRD